MENQTNDLWDGADIISTFTAEDMIEAGDLADVSSAAHRIGFNEALKVRMTRTVFCICEVSNKAIDNPALIQAMFDHRLESILTLLRVEILGDPKNTFWVMNDVNMSDGETMYPKLYAAVDGTSGPAIHIMVPSEY